MKLGLCLSGGGIKGFAHIGAIRALEERKIDFRYYSGTSSGSIIATLYACGYLVDEIENIFLNHVKDIKYVDGENIGKFFKNIFTGKGIKIDGLNSGMIIKKLVNKYCNEKGIYNISDIKKPLLIPAVNLCTEELYVFTNYINMNRSSQVKYIYDVDIGTAVQASCSFPGVFSPCKLKDDFLVDGGIAENVPWKEMKKLGVDRVFSIVFDTENECKKDSNILDVVSKSFKILNDELNAYEWEGSDYLLKIILPRYGLLGKVDGKNLIDEGYRQTNNYIDKIKDIY